MVITYPTNRPNPFHQQKVHQAPRRLQIIPKGVLLSKENHLTPLPRAKELIEYLNATADVHYQTPANIMFKIL